MVVEEAMKSFYLILCVLGTVLPWWQLQQFFFDVGGFDLLAFVGAAAENPVAAGFSIDIVISSVVFCTFIFGDGRRRGMTNLWVYVAANLLVGLSLALPLYLYRRTVAIEAERVWSA